MLQSSTRLWIRGATPRLDYAWLRLRADAPPPHSPAPIYVGTPALTAGDPVVSIGAGGGLPFKLDAGGHVRNARAETWDYFIADTDTFEGGSGGGAFDQQIGLIGILARGGVDFVPTVDGCNDVAQQPDGAAAEEQFTYASTAVAALCAKDPTSSSICRSDCQRPCVAGPRPPAKSGDGCELAGTAPRGRTDTLFAAAVAIVVFIARRRSTAL